MEEKRDRTFNMYGNSTYIEKQEINIHGGTNYINGAKPENDKTLQDRPQWEHVIPQYLRTDKWSTAWQKLREQGFLDENYQLTEEIIADEDEAKRIARYIATSFIKMNGKNEWTPFEKLWGMENLRTIKADPEKENKSKLEGIFSHLV